MPPISEYEFNKRFYLSGMVGILHRHPFHRQSKCKCGKLKRKEYCRDVIELLPKKLSQLDESSEQREIFWGIYAQEAVSLMRVLLYNLFCAIPLFWFFFMWMFKWGHRGDLQDAAVPLSLMTGMLSIFWSTFLGSLRFGRNT
jgi:hypothetical protein